MSQSHADSEKDSSPLKHDPGYIFKHLMALSIASKNLDCLNVKTEVFFKTSKINHQNTRHRVPEDME